MIKAEIQTLINTKLANGSDVTAIEHREVETALLNFIADSSPILKGTYVVGDASGTDTTRTVSFTDLGTSDYIVTGSLVSKSAIFDTDNDVFWMVKNKTSNSFQLLLREVSGQNQNLDFDYVIFKK